MGTLSSVRTTISTHYLQSIVASGHWHSLTCRHTAETNLLSSILHKSCEWKLKSAETCQLSSPGAKLALRWQQMCQLFYTENICHFQLDCRKKLLKYNLSILVFAQCTHHYRSNFTPVLVLGCIHTGLVWRWHGANPVAHLIPGSNTFYPLFRLVNLQISSFKCQRPKILWKLCEM